MNLFEIVGPVMVGPSSSHTAGAVRIGYICRRLLGSAVKQAELFLYGSFLATGKGHGTDRALIAGLLGMKPNDERIPDSFRLAEEAGLEYRFGAADIREAHPNTVKLVLTGEDGKTLEVLASSVGGGRIRICQVDGLEANFYGDYPTLLVHNEDQPGYVAEVTSMLSRQNINIATMQLYRNERGGHAVMVVECDREIPEESLEWLSKRKGITKVTYLGME
ncbi:MAG: L-serine ammonia-lyase, iron-sulfur-dependent, subunit beta [Lachnospiraceae bacterium]|jgi:L-serine dehydratase|nr:L-serine ammonia-lyase, iron-sulfur-dependent, subunit beta [Lachnospiraceae bacterium]